jgi:hypothetical protein
MGNTPLHRPQALAPPPTVRRRAGDVLRLGAREERHGVGDTTAPFLTAGSPLTG